MTPRRTPDIRIPKKPGGVRPTGWITAEFGTAPTLTDDETADARALAIAQGRIREPAAPPTSVEDPSGGLRIGALGYMLPKPPAAPVPWVDIGEAERHNAAFVRAAGEVPIWEAPPPSRTIARSGPVTVSRKLERAKATRRDNSDPSQWDRLFRGTK